MNSPIPRELTKSRPLLGLAVSAVLGILIADLSPPTKLYWFIILPALATPLLFRHWLSWTPLLLLLGLLIHSHRLDQTRRHPWRLQLEQLSQPTWVEIKGTVEQPLQRSLPGFDAGEALFRATHITEQNTPWPNASPTFFSLRLPSNENLPAGDYRVSGWLKLPPPTDNPGQFNKRNYDLRLGLIGQIQVAHILEATPHPWDISSFLIQTSEHCRDWISSTLNRHLPENCPESIVLLAMTLGTSDTTTPEMQTPFRLSGTLHIFAVSGLHVAIIGMIFWFLLRCTGISRSNQPLVLIPLLFAYTFLTGLPPSATRSAFMASILLLGMMSNRRSDLLNTLGTAAIILLAFDTNQLFNAGFQLSFGVLIAIALFGNLFKKPMLTWETPDPFLPKSLLTFSQHFQWQVRKFCSGTISVSAAAWIGSLPLMLAHFHAITPIGLIANLILVPWSFVVLSLSISRLVLAFLPFLQTTLSWMSYHAASFTLWSAQSFANIPYSNIYLPALENFPRPAAQLTVLRMPGSEAANHLRIDHTHWLLDCGSLRQFPFALQSYLHHQGINHIHHLIISHADASHHSAATSLKSNYRLNQISAPFPPSSSSPLTSIPWQHVHSPQQLLFPTSSKLKAKIDILFPPPSWQAAKADDRTLLARITIGNYRILWCNDAGFHAEKYLLDTLPPHALKCDIIIRNQHENDHSMLPEFLLATSPHVIISSNDTFLPEQHLPTSLRQQCLRQGILLYDQNLCGAVTINFSPHQIQIVPYRGNLPVFTLTSPPPSQASPPTPSPVHPPPPTIPPAIPQTHSLPHTPPHLSIPSTPPHSE